MLAIESFDTMRINACCGVSTCWRNSALAPAAALLPAAAASDDSLIAVPRVTAVKTATFQDNEEIELRGWSAPEYPG